MAALVVLVHLVAAPPARAAAPVPDVYEDPVSGFRLPAPPGWRLGKPGEFPGPVSYNAAFVDRRESVIVYVMIEFIPGGIVPQSSDSTRRYFDLIEHGARDTGAFGARTEVTYAGRPGLRASKRYRAGGSSFVNVVSVTHEGYYYFMLSSVAFASGARACEVAQAAFERAAVVTKTSDQVIRDLAATIGSKFDMCDDATAVLLMREMCERLTRLDAAESFRLGYELRERGRERLSAEKRSEIEEIEERGLAKLDPDIRDRYETIRQKVDDGADLTADDREVVKQVIVGLFDALGPDDRARFRSLLSEALRLGVDN